MSVISVYVEAAKAFQARQNTAVDNLVTDIKNLNDQIVALQGAAGEDTPENIAALEAIRAAGVAIADRLDALDGQTPPVAPKA